MRRLVPILLFWVACGEDAPPPPISYPDPIWDADPATQATCLSVADEWDAMCDACPELRAGVTLHNCLAFGSEYMKCHRVIAVADNFALQACQDWLAESCTQSWSDAALETCANAWELADEPSNW